MIRALGWLAIALLWLPVAALLLFEGADGMRLLTLRQWELLGKSIGYAAVTGFASCIAGFLIAFWAALMRSSARRFLLVTLVGAAALPSIVIATPSLILLLRAMPSHSQGMIPASAVQIFSFTPICALIALMSMSSLPKDQVDAARLLLPPSKGLFQVVLPLLRPGISAAFGVAGMLSVIDFTITSIFNWNTYSLEAFTDISAGQPVLASCAPLLLLGAVGAIVCGRWMSRLIWTESSLGFQPLPMPKWLVVSSGAATLAYAALVGGMFFGLLGTIDSIRSASISLANASGDAVSSVKINLVCCAVSIFWSLAIVPLLLSARSWVPWGLTLAPFAFLPTMVGIAFAQLGVRLGIVGVWLPALALAVRIVPVTAVIIAIWFGQIDRSAIEASRVCLSTVRRILRVYLPLSLPAIAVASCLSFISGLGDVGTMLLVVQPGQSTLSLRLYNYLHYGSAPDSTVISFIIMSVSMLLAYGFTSKRRAA